MGEDDDQTRPVTERAVAQAAVGPRPAVWRTTGGSMPRPAVAAAARPALRGEAALLAGVTFDGRYRLVRKLGQGGMGAVYLVDDLLLRRRVALKTLRLQGEDGDSELERFRKEAAITHAIHHPNVARTYDIGEEDGVHYLSMEWLPGDTLMDRLKASGPLPPAALRTVALRVADGLRAAHRAGVVHRDLKPANIMLVPDERVAVLMDFGIAAEVAVAPDSAAMDGTAPDPASAPGPAGDGESPSAWSVTSAGRGTPAYMAPEQWDERHGDARTDIYAFGVILYVALTGQSPFKARTTAELADHHRSTPAPDVRALVPAVDRDMAALIQRCMAKAPHDRPASMDVIVDLLQASARRRAWLRTMVGTALVAAVSVVALDQAVFTVVSRAVIAEMRPSLRHLASLVARDLDASQLAALRRPADMKAAAFAQAHAVLSHARDLEPDLHGAYVMRATERAGHFRVVVDLEPHDRDRDGDGTIGTHERGAATGDAYDGSDYPAMALTLATGRAQTDDAFGVDGWGVSLSGYAPVVLAGGAPTRMFVGVDVGNERLAALGRRLQVVLAAVAVAVTLAVALLTWPLAGGRTLATRLAARGWRRRTSALV